jgi:hypothetical protein
MTTHIQGTLEHIGRLNGEVDPVGDDIAPDQWLITTTAEGWPVGLAARHIADGNATVMGWLESACARQPERTDRDAIHRGNADGLAVYVAGEQCEVTALLRERLSALRAPVTGLLEAEFDRVALISPSGDQRNVELVLTAFLDGHTHNHIDSIRAPLGLLRFASA